MSVYIVLTVVTIIIAAFVHKTDVAGNKLTRRRMCNIICMTALFCLLFGVSACRTYVGNDYDRYVEFFHLISLDEYVPTEFGFNAVVRIMQWIFGTGTYLTIFALFSFGTVWFMLKALYDQSEDFFFSFTLFMLLTYYFQSLNTVRYYFVLAAAFYAAKYVLKKEYGKFILIITAAATIHKSVLLVIPVYILANRAWKKWQIALMGILAVSGLLFSDLYMKLIIFIYPSYKATPYPEGGTSIINIARCAGVLVLSLLFYKEAIRDNRQNTFYFNLNIMALFLYTCCTFVPEISRIGYYMTIGHVFLIPGIINRVPKMWMRKCLKWGAIAAGVLYFAVFLYKATDHLLRIVPYQTWILLHEVVD